MSNFYEAVGGEQTFRAIVHEFYKQVPEDDILGPMYPAEDLDGAEDRLRWFLAQYWGGPQEFNEKRGHPRLRMRHAQFTIDEAGRDRWLQLMSNALEKISPEQLPNEYRAAIWEHMERVANMLINAPSGGHGEMHPGMHPGMGTSSGQGMTPETIPHGTSPESSTSSKPNEHSGS
ncbi:globin [Corynebacterium sp. ED61]|nr:globin [Corynebacterium sp. ED61]